MTTFTRIELFTDHDGRAKFRELLISLSAGTPQSMLSPLLPAVAQTMTDHGFVQRLALVKQAQPDPTAVASLESFRQEALNYIGTASSDPSVTAELAETARKTIQEAKPPMLELVRSVSARLPASASAASRLQVVANLAHVSFDCAFTNN